MTTEEKRVLIHNANSSMPYLKLFKGIVRKYGLSMAAYLCKLIEKDKAVSEMKIENKILSVKSFGKKAESLILDGWFFCSRRYIESDTALSFRQQENIKKKLIEEGLIFSINTGLPSRQYFKLNVEKIVTFFNKPVKNIDDDDPINFTNDFNSDVEMSQLGTENNSNHIRDNVVEHKELYTEKTIKEKNNNISLSKDKEYEKSNDDDLNIIYSSPNGEDKFFSRTQVADKELYIPCEKSNIDSNLNSVSLDKNTNLVESDCINKDIDESHCINKDVATLEDKDNILAAPNKSKSLRDKMKISIVSKNYKNDVDEIVKYWNDKNLKFVDINSITPSMLTKLLKGDLYISNPKYSGGKYDREYTKEEIIQAIQNRVDKINQLSEGGKKKEIALPLNIWLQHPKTKNACFLKDLSATMKEKVSNKEMEFVDGLKQIYQKEIIGGIGVKWTEEDLSKFTRGGKRLHKFWKENLSKFRPSVDRSVKNMCKLMMRSIYESNNESYEKVGPGWLCSDLTFNQRLPRFLQEQGYVK